jgi:putative methyltransferase (TIGR04325 family)
MSARGFAKGVAPPILLDLYRRWSGRSLRFAGRPANWEQANSMSSGYAATNILERVTQATRSVVSGEARYERDSVLLDEHDPPFAALTALLRASNGTGRLEVIDFGGSLGSTYRHCRPFLDRLHELQWRVVEQPAFVATGRQEFTTNELSFFESLDDLPKQEGPRVILASSVLQYLENPWAVLDALSQLSAGHMVIDRTPMTNTAQDRICIQHVPKQIYAASYPCRLLSRQKLVAYLQKDWQVLCECSCAEGSRSTDDGLPFQYRGLILERCP